MKGKMPLPMFSKVPRIPAPTSPILFGSVGLLPNSPGPCVMNPQPSSCRFLAVGSRVLLVVRAPSRLFLAGGTEKLKGEKGRFAFTVVVRGSKLKAPDSTSEIFDSLDAFDSLPLPHPSACCTSGALARGVISSFLGRAEQTSAPKISCSNPDNRPCRLSMSLTRASSVSAKDFCSVTAMLLSSFTGSPVSNRGGSFEALKFSSNTGAKSRFICASSTKMPLMVMSAVLILFLFHRPSSLSDCITLESSRSWKRLKACLIMTMNSWMPMYPCESHSFLDSTYFSQCGRWNMIGGIHPKFKKP
mmetsp:Transcript_2003/g.4553  ORF Transcript_2003/g.4553 Transcript_2003/m.4553 type:complete len:302 (+) Transcript_2003:132-1037(+)